jgi:hypothetical protein
VLQLADYPEDLDVVRRLATNDRMYNVWRELQRHPLNRDAHQIGLDADKALELYFKFAWRFVRYPRPVVTAKDCEARAQEWSKAALLARELEKKWLEVRPDLAAVFDVAAKRFDQAAHDYEERPRLDSVLVVERYGGDDAGRAYVRSLGYVTRALFGNTLFRTTATTALGREITEQQVREWVGRDAVTPNLLGPDVQIRRRIQRKFTTKK